MNQTLELVREARLMKGNEALAEAAIRAGFMPILVIL